MKITVEQLKKVLRAPGVRAVDGQCCLLIANDNGISVQYDQHGTDVEPILSWSDIRNVRIEAAGFVVATDKTTLPIDLDLVRPAKAEDIQKLIA